MSAVEIVMPRLAAVPHYRLSADVDFACDHRAVYGADGAAFLARLRALLESPEVLVL